MRMVSGVVVAATLCVGIAGSAAAHNLTVTHPGTGEIITQQWISGQPLPPPAQGQGLFPTPFGVNQPAGHREGLPSACQATANSPAVTILAPPLFSGCVHGQP